MAVTFTGTDAEKQDKIARAKADLKAITGGDYTDLPPDQLGQLIDDTLAGKNLPHGNEQQSLDSLHNKALSVVLSQQNGAVGKEALRALFYMGYTSDAGPPENASADEQAAAAAKAIPAFLAKHPEFKNIPASDLPAKISDTLWAERRQQPQAAANQKAYGGGYGSYDDGYYGSAEDTLGQSVRSTAEATFGKDNIQLIQAQLYMRDPAHNKKPDGVWSMQDQDELNQFIQDENKNGHKDNPIPSPVAMRWTGTDAQKDFTARVTTALTNSAIIPAQQALLGTAKKDLIVGRPTQADGTSNAYDIEKMQLYLKLAGCYDGNTTPTGVWTTKDQSALQKFLDNPDHKRSGFAKFFGAEDPLPSTVDGLSGADFQKVLNYAANEAKEKNGITPDLANKLCPDITKPATEPQPVKPVVAAPAPTVTTPPPAPDASAPDASAPDVPHKVIANANTQKGGPIGDNDEARMQAQLNLMGYYNGQINGNAADTDAALKDYAAKKHIDLQGKSVDDHDVRAKLQAAVQKDWDAFARVNATALQQQIEAGHAVPENQNKNNPNDAVKQMQVVLLAAGGHLPNYGVDGLRWRETNAAYGEVTDANHQLKVKPAADDPAPPGTPTPAPAAAARPPYVDIDPVGPGGFITPPDNYNMAPAPQPASVPTPAANPAAGNPDFVKTGTPQGGMRSPVVTQDDIGSGRSSGTSAYFNGQANSDYGSASTFFQKIAHNPDYVMELKNRGWPLENMPYAGDAGVPKNLSKTFKHDQGQAFLTGPDARFAAQYAINGNHLSYVTTYDLTDPVQNQAFQNATTLAARQDSKNAGQQVVPGAVPPPGGIYQAGGQPGGLNIDLNVIGGGHRGGPRFPFGRIG